ncbi:MAG: hypothetical protein K0U45_03440 [Alphaproteobacteria bacterium]|nr:hypothetical protein [Alphaproteobacteria bacterium]
MTDNKPTLQFGRTSDSSGFMAELSNYSNVEPVRIIRELIQNALDAVREAGRNDTIVRFEIDTINKSEIPAIEEYSKAFECAYETQKEEGELSEPNENTATTIRETLCKDKMSVLYVLDNGIGFDSYNMRKVLSSGSSAKGNGGTGSFGEGHLTTIPSSDLRYLFYGGVSEKENFIASGHCMLASHDKNGKSFSSKGYFVNKLGEKSKERQFVTDNQIPPLIKSKIDWIANGGFDAKTGSVVIIPAFNHFRIDVAETEMEVNTSSYYEKMKKTISDAVACNFFAAIHEGKLTIQFNCKDNNFILKKENLESILDNIKENKNSTFLNGYYAYKAFQTVSQGELITIKTSYGSVKVKLLKLEKEGNKRIDLCRNGMWITYSYKLPNLQNYRFNDYENFNAVILLDKNDGDIHNLVRGAEGPEHKEINVTRYQNKDKQQKLRNAMREIREGIQEHLRELKMENFISDFWELRGKVTGGNKGDKQSYFGEWQPVTSSYSRPAPDKLKSDNPTPPGPVPNPDPTPGPKKVPTKKPDRSYPFQAIPIMTSARECKVEIRAQNDIETAEIRFSLNESYDATCYLTNEEPYVWLKDIMIDGKTLTSENQSTNNSGHIIGIRIDKLNETSSMLLDFKFDIPAASLKVNANQPVSLKTHIYQMPQPNKEEVNG